jgi:hypothetical protein
MLPVSAFVTDRGELIEEDLICATVGCRGSMVQPSEETRKPYVPPILTRRTLEQAKLLCLGYAWIGHRGARDLLELMFPEESESTRDIDH